MAEPPFNKLKKASRSEGETPVYDSCFTLPFFRARHFLACFIRELHVSTALTFFTCFMIGFYLNM